MKITRIVLLFVLFLSPFSLQARDGTIGVAAFAVFGPQESEYLSVAARDAVQGVLVRQNRPSKAIPNAINPDELTDSSYLKKFKTQALVTGRINIVGETYRAWIKWIDESGDIDQAYLDAPSLNQLIPEIENFTRTRLIPTLATAIGDSPLPEKAKEASTSRIPVQAPKPTESASVPSAVPKPQPSEAASDFTIQSQRLPYEVRSMAYADIDGDGQAEVLLTSQTELYLYRLEADGKLRELSKYRGKSLDHFVKVDFLPRWKGDDKKWVILTNLRGDRAASQILRYENGSFAPVFKDIPYQLRVVSVDGDAQLWGEAYRARGAGSHSIYELALKGESFKPERKIELPAEAELYSFQFLPGSTRDLVLLNASGRLKFFKNEGDKLKAVWTSRESYGESANDVEVEVKNAFNQVDSDYYVVPIGPRVLNSTSQVELILSKSDTLLADVVVRKPVVTSGRMTRLKWNGLSFDEVWESKRIDGSIMDYLVVPSGSSLKLLVALRLRDQGFLEGIGRKDSVLVTYDLP